MVVSVASFSITPAFDILLRGSQELPIGLFHLHMATAEQLCRLHYSMGSIKAVKAKLRTLVDNGYVQFDAMPTKLTRSPYYYAMDKLGMAYLQKAGLDISDAYRAGKEVDKHALFAQHTLDLNDIIVSAALLKRYNPNYWLEGFIHERELKRRPYKVATQGGNFSLISDTFMVFRALMPDGRQRRIPIIIEHDRGTEGQNFFRRRIRGYLIMLQNEGYKDLFNVGGITIAFTTSAGQQRLSKMCEWTIKELEEVGAKDFSSLFYFTLFNKPIEPLSLWIQPSWRKLYSNEPVALLEV